VETSPRPEKLEILFLDSRPSSHHKRFAQLFSSIGNVHSIYVDFHEEPPVLHFDLVVFADLDVTVDKAIKFNSPKIGISWAWDLQQTLRQGFRIEENLRKAINALDMLIVDSPIVEEVARGFGLPSNQIFRAPFGIDIEHYPLREFKKPDPARLRLYTNRRWEYLYRPRILLEMALELSEAGKAFELYMANDGLFRIPLTKEFSRLFNDGFCISLGTISQSDNIRELEKADIFISVAKSDGSSLSLLEAMAIGTLPLVTDNPANREWLEDEFTGYLFSGDTGIELATKIRSINLDSISRLRIPELSHEKVSREANWAITRESLLRRVRSILQ
jgi:glycosyltransferase involved in cell wall biosynthesis